MSEPTRPISPFNRPYSQENPRDQAKVLLGSLEGSLLMLKDRLEGHPDIQGKSVAQIEERIAELRQLVQLFMAKEW